MKHLFVTLFLLFVSSAMPVAAQTRMVDDTAGIRIAMLNAVLASRIDLLDGSPTVIAGCSLRGGEYTFPARANIDERFRKLLVRPETPNSSGQCLPEDFADPSFRVLFFEELTTPAEGKLRGNPSGRELVVRTLTGPDGSEATRYLVASEGVMSANGRSQDTGSRYGGWRVREYEFLGVQLHWSGQAKKVVKMYP